MIAKQSVQNSVVSSVMSWHFLPVMTFNDQNCTKNTYLVITIGFFCCWHKSKSKQICNTRLLYECVDPEWSVPGDGPVLRCQVAQAHQSRWMGNTYSKYFLHSVVVQIDRSSGRFSGLMNVLNWRRKKRVETSRKPVNTWKVNIPTPLFIVSSIFPVIKLNASLF